MSPYASRERGDGHKAAEVESGITGQSIMQEVEVAETVEPDKTEELIPALAVHQRLTLMTCQAALPTGKRGTKH